MDHKAIIQETTDACIKCLEDIIEQVKDRKMNYRNFELCIEILKVLDKCEDISGSLVLWAIHSIILASTCYPQEVNDLLLHIIDKSMEFAESDTKKPH